MFVKGSLFNRKIFNLIYIYIIINVFNVILIVIFNFCNNLTINIEIYIL